MADLIVDGNTTLDVFLRSKRTQQWRIPILVANGGVKVFRGKGGPTVKLTGAATRLRPQDVVRLVTPLPTPCVTAIQREADTNWRDYAVVPGSSPFDERMRKFMGVRTKTIVIKNDAQPDMMDLQGFLKGLATSEAITNPIRHLLVVGHASGTSGAFRIALTAGAEDRVDYEDLEAAVKSKTLNVDLSLLMPRPASAPQAPNVRLFGCSIGRAAPFMKKLKEAFGGGVIVIAPNHLLRGAALGPGELAYMAYGFHVFPPPPTPVRGRRPARKKKDLVDIFVKATKDEAADKQAPSPGLFTLVTGKPVPKTSWDAWVPASPEAPRWFPADPFAKPPKVDPHEIANAVMLPVFKTRDNAPRVFECLLGRTWFQHPLVLYLKRDPRDEAGRKRAVKAFLQKDNRYKDTHPFPEYVRAGYKTMDEFMDGWDWQFQFDAKKSELTYNPIRDEYELVQPITRVGVLVMNFYQTGTPPKRFRSQIPLEQLRVNDRFFFTAY